MNRILAIALMSIRNAIRSKVVLALLTFLVITLIGLPLTLQGDGTLAGHMRVLVRYTLGLTAFILSIATVWASCAAISTEIRDRQIQLVISKPVNAAQLWLGKWLGLMTINTVLLLLCFLSTYAALRWSTRPGRWSAVEMEQFVSELMVAQHRFTPRPRDLREDVLRRYEAGRARGEWPPDATTAEILPHLQHRVRRHANSVPQDASVRWVFDVPEAPPDDRPLILRYQFSVSLLAFEPVRGTWSVGAEDRPDRQHTDIESSPRMWHTLPIAPEMIATDGTLTIEFANMQERPVTVVFDPDRDLKLMVYAGRFLPNYFRAGLLILFNLSFLAAIGITAGAYFSIPVAALTSFYALILLHAAPFIGRMAEGEVQVSCGHAHGTHAHGVGHALDIASHFVHRGLYLVLRPLERANPLDAIAVGEWMAWSEVGYMFLVQVPLYSGALMLLGAWHIARKEVALPS